MRILYGAYGSNMNLHQMAHRCPRATVVGNATLKGYKLMFRGSGVANVEQAHHRNAVPLVIWDLTEECVKALDMYEGYPRLYTKHYVMAVMSDGEPRMVMIYTMLPKYENRPCLPWASYYRGIREGYEQNGIGFAPLRKALERTRQEVWERDENSARVRWA